MNRLPDAIFVIDSNKEQIAVREARKLGIPVVAVVDTNCDPTEVDYVIPGNDDALRAIRLFTSKISDSVAEGSQFMNDKNDADLAAAAGAAAQQAALAATEAPVEGPPVPDDVDSVPEDISMEEVLGAGVRKQPVAAKEPEVETPEVEHQTF
jgi:small subunit ribosomal protein S2